MIELPKELTDGFGTLPAGIAAIELNNDALSVVIELFDDFDEEKQGYSIKQKWQVKCRGVKSYKFEDTKNFFGRGTKYDLEIITDHPLLYPYNEIESELYFNGSTESLEKLLADIVAAHYEIVGDWFSLHDFIHQLPCIGILSAPYAKKDFKFGLFAKGPDKVMHEYRNVMERYQIPTNIINRRQPKYWNGSTWADSSNDNIVLFIRNDYVISNSIQVKKLS